MAGSHTYTDEGSLAGAVRISTGTVDGTAAGTVTVGEGDSFSPVLNLTSATEAVPVSGTVATFGDSNTAAQASDFTATIDWGDGTLTAGTVSGGAGTFTVAGSHTYSTSGSKAVVVTLTDDAPGTATAAASGTVTVAGGPTTTTALVTPASVVYGHERAVSFRATVVSVAPSGGTPTGSVAVQRGPTTLCTISLISGTGTCSPSSDTLLPAAPVAYPLTFTYSGDSAFLGSMATSSMSVARAPLSVRAVDIGRQLGGPTPSFSATYAGLVGGEGPSALGGTLAFSTSPATVSATVPGTYAIIPSGLTSSNYTITFVNGVLTTHFRVCLLYDPSHGTDDQYVVLAFYLCDSSGHDLSAPSQTLTAIEVDANGGLAKAIPVDHARITFVSLGRFFLYVVDTSGLARHRSYILKFRVSTDPPGTYESAAFTLR